MPTRPAYTLQLHLDDLHLFTRVAELGSLSAAARERDAPVSQVSRTLKRIEAASAVRLLHRSTHDLSLTDEGDTFLAYCRRLLDTSTELASELSGKAAGPSGWVRISVSPVIAEYLIAPSLPGLAERHPQVQVDVCADDRMADMAREGIDIAIRTGQLASDNLVARRIGDYGRVLVASPAYIARCGEPRSVAELDQHHLIANSANPALNRWPLAGPGHAGKHYQVKPRTRTDNSAMILALAREGVGLARVMDVIAAPLILQGALLPLLQDELSDPRQPVYAVTLYERQRLPKLRACMDYWEEWLGAVRI